MTIITRSTLTSQNQYALIRKTDAYGAGYLVQHVDFLQAAIRDGWDVLMSNLTYNEAQRAKAIYEAPLQLMENPSLDSLTFYDENEDVTQGLIEEFDIVNVKIEVPEEFADYPGQQQWVQATVTSVDVDTLEVEILAERYGYMDVIFSEETFELVMKADSSSQPIIEWKKEVETYERNEARLFQVAAWQSELLSA